MATMSVPALKTLDCRGVSAAVRDAAVLEAFDGLRPGETLVFQSGGRPSAALERLQRERKGLFEWSPLEEGSALWRIEVLRRSARKGELRAITEALSWDHDRLDALEASAFEARGAGAFELAARIYSAFAQGLKRHIRFEEELLFPAFEACTGLSPTLGPTAVMRSEHREIVSLLEAIAADIGASRPATDLVRKRRAFHDVLGGHNFKEEQILYPGTDRALSAAESDELVARIQAL